MPEAYKLAASPILFSEGQFKGKLKGVAFTATSTRDTKRWRTVNCGQFPMCVNNLVPDGSADAMVAALVRGDDVEFPGQYQEEELKCGFTYIHEAMPVISADLSSTDGGSGTAPSCSPWIHLEPDCAGPCETCRPLASGTSANRA